MAKREAKNFYWGFISLPYEQRIAIYALYNFARQVDDESDANWELPDLPGRLARHRQRVSRCMHGEFDDEVMQVLAVAVKRFGIPERELQMLIDGCEMDFTITRYETWDQLRDYCNLVASVIGRMCVRIFGFSDPVALERADDLGIALQLTNILRDVREDAGMGRVYLPLEDLRRFDITEEAMLAGTPGSQWNALIEHECKRANDFYASGYEVLRYIPRRPAVCVQTMAGIYEGILHKVSRDPALPLRERIALSQAEKVGVMVKSWLRAG